MKVADESVLLMMGERPSELDLMAYADGELDAAAGERVRQYLLADPQAAAKVKLHQQLRAAGCRACKAGVEVPVPLQQRIQGLANAPEYDDRGYPLNAAAKAESHAESQFATDKWQSPLKMDNRRRFGFRLIAAAALLFVGLGTVAMILMPERGMTVVKDSPLLKVSLIDSTAAVHNECSHHASHFGPGFPEKVEELPQSLRQYLGHDAKVPDLSKLGYKFAGAGPCQIPGGKTAHLLYRPISGGNITTFTVSLFVQADTGQLPIDSGKVYFAEDKIYNTPMIIWRGDGVLYFLVGENNNQLSDAARQIGMKVRI